MLRSLPVPALLLLALASPCLAAGPEGALSPETDQPYHLRVVLGVAEHRLLTPVFRQRLEHQLRDSLQAALGDLAVVEVVHEHPRLPEVMRDGLGTAFEAWKDVDGIKTHFVLLSYAGGEYEIQTRQHDGLTGRASAVARRAFLPDSDRELVARTAALMVNEDFGVVGTVTGPPGGDTVQVTLKGSALGVPLGDWVKEGDVFVVSQITGAGGSDRAVPVPWTVLRVAHAPDNGVCVCQAFFRPATSPLKDGPGVKGYRCLKWTTTHGPLRLRLVQAGKTAQAVPPQHIDVRHLGFTGEERTLAEGTTDLDGYFTTEKNADHGTFDGVAFVKVLNGTSQVAKVPVPIVDNSVVVIPMTVEGSQQDIARRRDLWLASVYQSYRILAAVFDDESRLLKDSKNNEEALRRAKEQLATVQADLPALAHQRDELMRDAGGKNLNLSGGDQALTQMKALEGRLKHLIARLEEVVSKENSSGVRDLKSKVAQAQAAEDQANFEDALKLYREVGNSELVSPELKNHIADLEAKWAIKSDKQKSAREFIYDIWPTLNPLKLLGYLGQAREALQACEQAGDTLTPQKLLIAASNHAGKLQELLTDLKDTPEDQDTAKKIVEVADGLNKLIKETKAYLDSKGGASPEK